MRRGRIISSCDPPCGAAAPEFILLGDSPRRNSSRWGMPPWWSQGGSNPRPLACHASALPAELWPRRHGTGRWRSDATGQRRWHRRDGVIAVQSIRRLHLRGLVSDNAARCASLRLDRCDCANARSSGGLMPDAARPRPASRALHRRWCRRPSDSCRASRRWSTRWPS